MTKGGPFKRGGDYDYIRYKLKNTQIKNSSKNGLNCNSALRPYTRDTSSKKTEQEGGSEYNDNNTVENNQINNQINTEFSTNENTLLKRPVSVYGETRRKTSMKNSLSKTRPNSQNSERLYLDLPSLSPNSQLYPQSHPQSLSQQSPSPQSFPISPRISPSRPSSSQAFPIDMYNSKNSLKYTSPSQLRLSSAHSVMNSLTGIMNYDKKSNNNLLPSIASMQYNDQKDNENEKSDVDENNEIENINADLNTTVSDESYMRNETSSINIPSLTCPLSSTSSPSSKSPTYTSISPSSSPIPSPLNRPTTPSTPTTSVVKTPGGTFIPIRTSMVFKNIPIEYIPLDINNINNNNNNNNNTTTSSLPSPSLRSSPSGTSGGGGTFSTEKRPWTEKGSSRGSNGRPFTDNNSSNINSYSNNNSNSNNASQFGSSYIQKEHESLYKDDKGDEADIKEIHLGKILQYI